MIQELIVRFAHSSRFVLSACATLLAVATLAEPAAAGIEDAVKAM
jgi:hypothetical protein